MALRTLTRTPATPFIIVLVRMVSIGASVAIFTLIDASLLNAATDTTLRATLLGLFSAAALFLAVIGVYSAVSATVRQRWHDMSIRLALGARSTQLRRRVVRDVLHVAVLGTAAGLLAPSVPVGQSVRSSSA